MLALLLLAGHVAAGVLMTPPPPIHTPSPTPTPTPLPPRLAPSHRRRETTSESLGEYKATRTLAVTAATSTTVASSGTVTTTADGSVLTAWSTIPVAKTMGLIMPNPYKDVYVGLDYTFGWVEPGPRPGAYAGGWLRTIEPMLIMPNLTVDLFPVTGTTDPTNSSAYPLLSSSLCAAQVVDNWSYSYGFKFDKPGWYMYVINETWVQPTVENNMCGYPIVSDISFFATQSISVKAYSTGLEPVSPTALNTIWNSVSTALPSDPPFDVQKTTKRQGLAIGLGFMAAGLGVILIILTIFWVRSRHRAQREVLAYDLMRPFERQQFLQENPDHPLNPYRQRNRYFWQLRGLREPPCSKMLTPARQRMMPPMSQVNSYPNVYPGTAYPVGQEHLYGAIPNVRGPRPMYGAPAAPMYDVGAGQVYAQVPQVPQVPQKEPYWKGSGPFERPIASPGYNIVPQVESPKRQPVYDKPLPTRPPTEYSVDTALPRQQTAKEQQESRFASLKRKIAEQAGVSQERVPWFRFKIPNTSGAHTEMSSPIDPPLPPDAAPWGHAATETIGSGDHSVVAPADSIDMLRSPGPGASVYAGGSWRPLASRAPSEDTSSGSNFRGPASTANKVAAYRAARNSKKVLRKKPPPSLLRDPPPQPQTRQTPQHQPQTITSPYDKPLPDPSIKHPKPHRALGLTRNQSKHWLHPDSPDSYP